MNNGLLPARVGEAELDALITDLGEASAPAQVDLRDGTVSIGATTLRFDLDPVWCEKLINGWDDIDLTRQHETRHRRLSGAPHGHDIMGYSARGGCPMTAPGNTGRTYDGQNTGKQGEE